MNLIPATITQIDSVEPLHIIKFSFGESTLSMMSLELPHSMAIDKKVNLTVNPSYIALAKGDCGVVSYSNQIPATILSIETGKLLSSIKLQAKETTLESIITTESAQRMELEVGDEVKMLIKASELSMV